MERYFAASARMSFETRDKRHVLFLTGHGIVRTARAQVPEELTLDRME